MVAQDTGSNKAAENATSFSDLIDGNFNVPNNPSNSIKNKGTETTTRTAGETTVEFPVAEGCEDLDVLDFEGIAPFTVAACGQTVDATTNNACFSPGDLPVGVSFSARFNDLIRLGQGINASSSATFTPNFFFDDMIINFSVPVNYVEFDIQSLTGTGTIEVIVFDGGGAVDCSQDYVIAGNTPQKMTFSSAGLISKIELNDVTSNVTQVIDNFGFGYNVGCGGLNGFENATIGCDQEPAATYDSETEEYTLTVDGCYYGSPYNADAMTTLTQELCGDGEIIVKFEGGSSIGWAGINMRETLDPGSKKVQMMQNGSFFGRREVRTMTNGFAFPQQMFVFGKPWMRLVRNGNQFSGYVSANGVNWQFVMTQLVSMADCIEVGMVATTINVNTTYTATFSNVQVIQAGEGLQAVPNTIAQSNAALGLGLTPNPARDLVTLNLDQVIGEAATISIFNMNGQLMEMIQYDSIEDANEEINISILPVGTYYVNVKTTSTQETLKLIKQ
jgi:hypothetical protein